VAVFRKYYRKKLWNATKKVRYGSSVVVVCVLQFLGFLLIDDEPYPLPASSFQPIPDFQIICAQSVPTAKLALHLSTSRRRLCFDTP